MKISREEVLRVAELAHLELTEAEAETYRGQLDSILEYIETLNRLDVSQIEPMAQMAYAHAAPGATPLRDDVARPCDVGEAILAQAPKAEKPYFRVPKVIER
ncbi:MAG TPA: Asp-tRNA(Asn)/Glu-tRNA(Gln) amidotransferase subunit GatC [Candidatus Acidoferrales bacterium]|nr:Asp-tRNA(Asn)/Glu-tRNA(Gln) amidotransferase subunit GatC [Candidatus Acidoferrum sp.]HUJ81384.1 Asp-tRNA(Asn)/Glu-tRNA(Gln) amidotransferase subunit GatC [Candidatus Acidoferrales bacterium]